MTPDLKTCQELKVVGYPQEGAREYWLADDEGHTVQFPLTNDAAKAFKKEYLYAIPELQPFLDWFVKDFAERWAEKHRAKAWCFVLDRRSYKCPRVEKGYWSAEMLFEDTSTGDARSEDREFSVSNPDPLTAVLALFKQMDEEMKDE